MPTVEIVSLDCNRLLPIKNSTLPFTVLQNRKLISHRSLFQEELNKINGTILHLGNKEFGRNTCFFASELIDWDSEVKKMYGNISFEDFIKKQNGEYYIFNTLYEIHK